MIINYENDDHRERIHFAIRMIKDGLIGPELNEALRHTFKLSKRSAEDFLAEARKVIKSDVQESAVILREAQIMRYLSLYKEAVKNDDLKTANNILSNIDKLYGLQSQKIETKGEVIISFE